jgi:hypothetical protein
VSTGPIEGVAGVCPQSLLKGRLSVSTGPIEGEAECVHRAYRRGGFVSTEPIEGVAVCVTEPIEGVAECVHRADFVV